MNIFKSKLVWTLGLCFFVTVGGCNSVNDNNNLAEVQSPVTNTQSLSEVAGLLKTEEACKANSGEWGVAGRAQLNMCILSASDAGKSCSDASQCDVDCLAESRIGQEGGDAVGRCSATTNPFGCRTHIKDGKVAMTLCVD